MILGIDTGGTYTDTVIVREEDNKIIEKAKSFTTHDDLSKGIGRCIDLLNSAKLSEINRVNISTTLAVNAILEHRFDKVGLLQLDKGIRSNPPANYTLTVKNPFNRIYKDRYEGYFSELLEIRKNFLEHVEYVVVTCPGENEAVWYEHQMVDTIKRDVGLNAFSVRDYCTYDDYTQRTVSAMLTIYLIPIISRWIDSISNIMREKGINAKISIMNATGRLITCEDAKRNPLSTLFSGLASSVQGGMGLTERGDFILVDMGGTSTDITRIIDRKFREVKAYAKVGAFDVGEKTMDVQTFGIGGDSHISINQNGLISVGPQRAIPLCVMCSKYPQLILELKNCKCPDGYEMLTAQDVDCFVAVKPYRHDTLNDFEMEILKYISDEPHNIFNIADFFRRDPDALHMDRLLRKGAVKIISLTPTDVLHAEGKYTRWNTEGSNLAICKMAGRLKITKASCIKTIREVIVEKLIRACMQSIANFEKEQFDFEKSPGAAFMLDCFYGNGHMPGNSMIEMSFGINKPIVALGAPSGEWLKQVAERLNTELIVPEHGDVANAFGVAIAKQGG